MTYFELFFVLKGGGLKRGFIPFPHVQEYSSKIECLYYIVVIVILELRRTSPNRLAIKGSALPPLKKRNQGDQMQTATTK